MARVIAVRATWDAEARVWVAESDDLPLVTEAATVEALAAKLPGIIRDLLEKQTTARKRRFPWSLWRTSPKVCACARARREWRVSRVR